jgi:membrane associated rhomboid family serine protease
VFLPIGDTPNPPRFTPWVNYGLIAANILVFLAITLPLAQQPANPGAMEALDYFRALGSRPRTAYDVFIFENGFKPGDFSLTDLFASMFLHGGVAHIFGNMLFLWIYGDNVEHHLGRLGYLLAYLGTGVAATLTFAVFDPNSMVPMVGASGAISGVLGFYFVLFPRNQIKVFIFLFPILFNVFLVPARIVLGIYLVFDNLVPVLLGAETGVAYGAHIGGFVAGLALAVTGERTSWTLPRPGNKRNGKRRSSSPSTGKKAVGLKAVPDESDLDDLIDALERNDRRPIVDVAGSLSPSTLQELPLTDQLRVADELDRAGRRASATHLLRHAAARNQTDRESLARIYLTLGLLRLRGGQGPAAYQHLLNALDLSPSSPTGRRAREALDQIPTYRRSGSRAAPD